MVSFAALIGLAIFFDNYFEENPVDLDELTNESSQPSAENGTIYLFSQNSSTTAKTSEQKAPDRKNFQQSHNKLLQKYHQLRNYQVLKEEAKIKNMPLILTCYFLIFRSYHFTLPDGDVPLHM